MNKKDTQDTKKGYSCEAWKCQRVEEGDEEIKNWIGNMLRIFKNETKFFEASLESDFFSTTKTISSSFLFSPPLEIAQKNTYYIVSMLLLWLHSTFDTQGSYRIM